MTTKEAVTEALRMGLYKHQSDLADCLEFQRTQVKNYLSGEKNMSYDNAIKFFLATGIVVDVDRELKGGKRAV